MFVSVDVSFDFLCFYVVGREFYYILTVVPLALFFFSCFAVRPAYRIPAFVAEDPGERVIAFAERFIIFVGKNIAAAGLLRREGMRIALANSAGIDLTAVDVSDHGVYQQSY